MQSDKLFYYSKSSDKKPGKGVNEFVSDPEKYKTLSEIKDWRKILSNFYVDPFEWNNKTWNSVEHAFQSSKIALVNPEKAEWFTLESGHDLGKGDGNEARKHRKMVLLPPNKLSEWNQIKSGIMKDILYAKFSQVPIAANVLLNTKDAEMWHSPGRVKAERQYELEDVRKQLLVERLLETNLNI